MAKCVRCGEETTGALCDSCVALTVRLKAPATNPHTDASRLLLFETAELVRELTNRHPACCIAYVECIDGEPDGRSMRYEMGTDVVANMGLSAALQELTRRTFNEQIRRRRDD